MNGFQLQIVLVVGGVVGTAGFLLLSARSIRYHLTATHLTITWLGLTVRSFRLDDIKRIGGRPVAWAERWPNSWERGRAVVIRRHTGWFRNLVITPKFPFEFRNSLEQARRVVLGLPTIAHGTALAGDPATSAPVTQTKSAA